MKSLILWIVSSSFSQHSSKQRAKKSNWIPTFNIIQQIIERLEIKNIHHVTGGHAQQAGTRIAAEGVREETSGRFSSNRSKSCVIWRAEGLVAALSTKKLSTKKEISMLYIPLLKVWFVLTRWEHEEFHWKSRKENRSAIRPLQSLSAVVLKENLDERKWKKPQTSEQMKVESWMTPTPQNVFRQWLVRI